MLHLQQTLGRLCPDFRAQALDPSQLGLNLTFVISWLCGHCQKYLLFCKMEVLNGTLALFTEGYLEG